MKSNQERSNECLPPKKREIPASDRPAEEKPQAAGPASESQRGENLAWLASVAGGHDGSGGQQRAGTPPGPDGAHYKPSTEYSAPSSSSSSSSSPSFSRAVVTCLPPAAYSSALSQPGGAIQYAQLPPNLHFINSAYAGPYAGYISPQLAPPASASAPPARPRQEAYAQASAKAEQRAQLVRSPGGVAAVEGAPQYVHVTGSSPLSVTSSQAASSHHAHLPLHLHPHTALLPQGLALGGASQLLLHYSPQDRPTKKEEGRSREALNGELEAGRHYGLSPESILGKQSAGAKAGSSQHPQHHHHHHHQQHQQQQQQQHHHYEARQVLIPSDHAQETSGLRTPLMLVSNSHGDPRGSPEKPPPPSGDKGGICLGRPASRASPFAFPAPQPCVTVAALSPHSVIQTTHSATEQVSAGLPSNSFYPPAAQPPIIGCIAGGQQAPVGYPAGLAPQLVIPGGQPMIIPMSDPAHTSAAAAAATQQLVTAAVAKCEPFQGAGPYHAAAVVQAQLHLPAGALATPPPPPPSAPSLPPYFMKGSIIQLADGELKRVEDLRTEDFLQSAEISGELKIDSSTVERIDGSPTPNFAIVQFAVGEHRAQVSVEVQVEYPFFVFGKGWSSCCPDRTTQLFELACSKLSVGDVCISLTLKSLRNGSKKAQALDAVAGNGGLLLKPPKGRGGHHGEQENGLGRRAGPRGGGAVVGGGAQAENGELSLGEKAAPCGAPPPKAEAGGAGRPTGRKRRWSAPESRKVEKVEEEPPLTLPKPSFIPQEVKICIEGRSSIGK